MRTLGILVTILFMSQTASAEDPKTGYGKTQGVIQNVPLIFGPRLSVSVPHPSIGLEVKYDNLVGASFDYGFIPDITISNTSAGINGWHFDGKVYPFRNAFYVGAALGGRTLTGSYTDTSTSPAAVTGSATVSAIYLAPVVGFHWVYENGLFLGVEAGWEIVLSFSREYSSAFNLLPPDKQNSINDNVDKYGKVGLPHVSLFQIGYFF